MFICLSSGSRPQYRDDIFRALALPSGSVLQFRYDKRYLTQATRTDVENKAAAGMAALIVYIDQATKDKPPAFVPCRYAKVKSVAEHGTTVSVELIVDDFAYADNLQSFTQWLQQTFPNDLPHWHEGNLEGKYWLKSPQAPTTPVRTTTLGNWENVIVQLAGTSDFQNECCFFTVTQVVRKGKKLPPTDGTFVLDSGSAYEMLVYHYHPSKFADNLKLELAVADGCGVTVLTNPSIRIDSRYDQKTTRFQTERTPSDRVGFITFAWSKGGDTDSHTLFDIPVRVKGAFWSSVGFALALAVFLAGPQVFAAWTSTTLSLDRAIWSTVVATVCGLAAGLFAAFGLKKSW